MKINNGYIDPDLWFLKKRNIILDIIKLEKKKRFNVDNA